MALPPHPNLLQELQTIVINALSDALYEFLSPQEVAVFVFDKKIIDKYQKFDKDQVVDSLKRGVQQLTRLRHPRLLTVQHPLEESRCVSTAMCLHASVCERA